MSHDPPHSRGSEGATPEPSVADAIKGGKSPLEVIFENIQDVVYLLDIQGGRYRFAAINPAFTAATGLPASSVVGRWLDEVIPPESLPLVLAQYARAIARRGPVHWEETSRYPKGTRIGEVMAAPVIDATGRCVQLVGTVHDVTSQRRDAERLHKLAHFDALTGLPNRRHFFESLQREVAQAQRMQQILALFYIDLDGFKEVNDTHGHEAGDALLQQVADRLVAGTRQRDLCGRMGGDEFVVAAEVDGHPQGAAGMAGHLAACLTPPYVLGAHTVSITPSIGIAACPVDTCDSEALLRFADIAMYHAKADGQDTYRFYEPEMNAWAAARRDLEAALRTAVRERQFTLAYQPLVRLRDRGVVGVEALLRWERPGQGTVGPCDFVPLLEDTGLIVEVGAWAIDAACAQLCTWRERDGLLDLCMSLNVSGRQLALARRLRDARLNGNGHEGPADVFAATLREAIARHAIPADRVQIEITESTLMEDAQQSARVLHELAAIGIRIHVDDFGTGYSSLAYLKRFPIDSLKIDREFVRGLPADVEDRAITQAILGLGGSLGLGVVAEGIEDEAQAAFLLEAGCEIGQGFAFSRPLAGEAVAGFVRAGMRESNNNAAI